MIKEQLQQKISQMTNIFGFINKNVIAQTTIPNSHKQ